MSNNSLCAVKTLYSVWFLNSPLMIIDDLSLYPLINHAAETSEASFSSTLNFFKLSPPQSL
ncbi:MAG: hypothetical protein HUJ68_11150 [Clostridia bacterium]|nr:hypothetical protein [Clostridia bacterium]